MAPADRSSLLSYDPARVGGYRVFEKAMVATSNLLCEERASNMFRFFLTTGWDESPITCAGPTRFWRRRYARGFASAAA